MGFEILFEQIVLFGIENAGRATSRSFFGERIADVGRFKIDLDRAGIGQACRLAQQQATTAAFQFGFGIT